MGTWAAERECDFIGGGAQFGRGPDGNGRVALCARGLAGGGAVAGGDASLAEAEALGGVWDEQRQQLIT